MILDDFINAAVNQLGIGESVAKDATGKVLGMIKNGLGDQFSEVASKLPGAEQLMEQSASSDQPGGGLLGSVTKAASSMLGGGAGQGMEVMGALQKSGLSVEQGGSFITMFIDFIKQKIGDELVAKIFDKIPALRPFVVK